MSMVIDASAVAAWAFLDERSATSVEVLRRVGREGAVVPAVWPLEVANLLLGGERRGRITRGERESFLTRLAALPIQIEQATLPGVREVLALADAHGLSTYDGAYLELSARLRLPLVSKDRALVDAAAMIGVSVVPA